MKSPKPKVTQADITARQERDARIAANQAALESQAARRRRRSAQGSLISASQAGNATNPLPVPLGVR